MRDPQEIIDDSSLPPAARERIGSLLTASGLVGERAADVARELVAHFEDGLSAGRSIDELLASFGDDDLAADLIARATARADCATRTSPDRIAGAHRATPGKGGRNGGAARGDTPLAPLWRNLRHAVRRIAQSPGFAAVAVLSLAIGIGANTAIFTLVNVAILRDLPVESSEELVELYTSIPGFRHNIFSYPNFRDVRDNTEDLFEAISVSGYAFPSVDRNGGVELVPAEVVSGEYFRLLGVQPEIGRLLGPDDDVAEGAHSVAVLGHGYWQRAFGGDPDVVGERLRINGMDYEIVGIVPEWYTGNMRGFESDLYLPIMMANQLPLAGLEQRSAGSLFTRARLREGVSLQEVQARLDTIAAELKQAYPDHWDPNNAFVVYPSNDVIMWPPIDRILVPAAGLFMTVVGLVLLVACANLAGVLLARAMDRQKEIAVRLALGATRRSVVAQLLTETMVLTLLGAVGGIAVSVWSLRLLLAVDLPLLLTPSVDPMPDATVLAFTTLVALLAGALFGLAPALHGGRSDVAATLKEGGSGADRPRRVRLRNALVAAQVAFSLVLLVAAGLFVRSARASQSIDPGFGDRPTGLMTIMLSTTSYDDAAGQRFLRTLRQRLRQLPGVAQVGIISNLHLTLVNTQFGYFNVDGLEPPPDARGHIADRATVDAWFFAAAGVDILRGRNFNEADTDETAAVVIVSEALERRFFPGGSAIGKVLHPAREGSPDLTIVGVARDTKVRLITEEPRPFIYYPLSQRYTPFVTFLARTAGDAGVTARAMLQAGRELDPELTVFETNTIERHIGVQLLPARLAAGVLTGFAVLTLLLAAIGLYGVVAYAVARRTREVGIRISLGAESGDVIRMLTVGGMKPVLAGGAAGLVLSLLVAYGMATLLYGVGAFDPRAFAAALAILAAVAFLAAWLPARRAARVDPVIALRAE